MMQPRSTCQKPFDGGKIYGANGQPYCAEHYGDIVGSCDVCGKAFTGSYLNVGGGRVHKECVVRGVFDGVLCARHRAVPLTRACGWGDGRHALCAASSCWMAQARCSNAVACLCVRNTAPVRWTMRLRSV